MSLRNAPLTIALLVVNLLIFAADFFLPSKNQSGVGNLMYAGAIIPELVARGEYYRIVTAGFLHFDIRHIAFNMYALTQAGMVVENLYGSTRFAAIYFIALVVGGIAAYETTLGTPAVTAGASGAIMGLFGAMAALGIKTPSLRGPLLSWALFPIVATLGAGLGNPGISNSGHIGGLIAGAITGFVLPATRLRNTVSV